MAESHILQDDDSMLDYTPAVVENADNSLAGGQVIQLADGRAAVATRDVDEGVKGAVQVEGLVRVAKTTSIVILDGGRVFWDHSANKAHFKSANDRDFYVGVAVGDAASDAEWLTVDLNKLQRPLLDIATSPCTTATVGTAAAEGFGRPKRVGGSTKFLITATNEAQKVDLLSNQGFAPGANAIVEAIINVVSDGSGTATDVSIGIANGTHASDADTITESLFIHLDGNSTTIRAESDDNTTEVTATDTTKTYAEGTPFEVWFDTRNTEDIQVYVDGVNVLPDSVFKLNAATGPLKLLVHVEKTSSTDTYELDVERLIARTAEQ